jgi:RNA polymerase sigma-70 factor (ECF subfamily)
MMAAAQQGDGATYMRLLHQVVPLIRSLLRGRTPPAAIEDVVQDVLLTLHRVRHTYDPARPFVPWLAAITQRRAIDAARRRLRVRAHEQAGDALDAVADPAAPDTPDPVEADNRAAWLREAVRALPRQQRTAVELVKLDELTIAEAASRSGQSPGAVRVNVHRGMIALRRLLGGAAA